MTNASTNSFAPRCDGDQQVLCTRWTMVLLRGMIRRTTRFQRTAAGPAADVSGPSCQAPA